MLLRVGFGSFNGGVANKVEVLMFFKLLICSVLLEASNLKIWFRISHSIVGS